MTLYSFAFPNQPAQLTDWSTSVLLAIQNSLPQTAQGKPLDPAFVLGRIGRPGRFRDWMPTTLGERFCRSVTR